MSNAKVALVDIVDKVPNAYNTNERWDVKKMKAKYVNRITTILPIIYYKYKVQYFSNKFAMMISKVDYKKFVNWVAIMYFQLVNELIRWDKCQKNMIKRTAKREPKKNVSLLHIVPFCEGPNEKPEGFVKQK